MTQKIQSDLDKIQLLPNMTWPKELMNIFNATNLNMTNLDFFNVTKKMQNDLDKIQVSWDPEMRFTKFKTLLSYIFTGTFPMKNLAKTVSAMVNFISYIVLLAW